MYYLAEVFCTCKHDCDCFGGVGHAWAAAGKKWTTDKSEAAHFINITSAFEAADQIAHENPTWRSRIRGGPKATPPGPKTEPPSAPGAEDGDFGRCLVCGATGPFTKEESWTALGTLPVRETRWTCKACGTVTLSQRVSLFTDFTMDGMVLRREEGAKAEEEVRRKMAHRIGDALLCAALRLQAKDGFAAAFAEMLERALAAVEKHGPENPHELAKITHDAAALAYRLRDALKEEEE